MVQARRFRCGSGTCCRAIFSERLDPGLARPHGRRTARLQGLIRQLALALGGRAAQALGQRLMLSVSKDTFLRSLCPPDEGRVSAARFIGIDDWAWRKGQRYGVPHRRFIFQLRISGNSAYQCVGSYPALIAAIETDSP